jgi:hypothetical protein
MYVVPRLTSPTKRWQLSMSRAKLSVKSHVVIKVGDALGALDLTADGIDERIVDATNKNLVEALSQMKAWRFREDQLTRGSRGDEIGREPRAIPFPAFAALDAATHMCENRAYGWEDPRCAHRRGA